MNSLEALRVQKQIAEKEHGPLLEEKAKLERQHNLFLLHLETAEVMNDEEGLLKARQALDYIETKMDKVNKELSKLNDLTPLAQSVFDEGDVELTELSKQVQDQFSIVLSKRDDYLTEIKKLGAIRQKSLMIKSATTEAGTYLKRNPLPAIIIQGFHKFEVSMDLLKSLVG